MDGVKELGCEKSQAALLPFLPFVPFAINNSKVRTAYLVIYDTILTTFTVTPGGAETVTVTTCCGAVGGIGGGLVIGGVTVTGPPDQFLRTVSSSS